ncbi:MAG TPA: RNA 2',3'-cyclic phosphodiesterase [Candidatus Limiplasma sp.]|nr:RNA 2',3'-cyclic phosphodiesterase [Candidatus Limiplasma sp.]HPS81035.1 RNA 2',3'-cyclic phosphodiesterase [Candidatus Limiplasma sp.]
MRLFVGLALKPDYQEALSAAVAPLWKTVPARVVPASLYHITLAYLGERAQSDLVNLRCLLTEAVGQGEPFSLSAQALGYFGVADHAILIAGVQATPSLWALNERLRSVLRRNGEIFDDQTLVPHITLARKARLTDGLPALPLPKQPIRVEALTLFHSARIEGNLCYVSLFSVPIPHQKERSE